VSYFEGVKTTYNAFIDETNIGKIVVFHEELTDEESGLEISVTVKPSDIDVFAQTAKRLFKNFTVKPIIKNNDSVTDYLDNYKGAQTLFSGADWNLGKLSNYYDSTSLFCVMGNIFYPIDFRLRGHDRKGMGYCTCSDGSQLRILPSGGCPLAKNTGHKPRFHVCWAHR
jgi:hypothetical protein